MTDQPPPGSHPGYPQPVYPGQPPPNPQGPRVWRNGLLVGLVIGLVIGAGVVGLVWAMSGSDGAEADAEAVCGIVERTPRITEDTPTEELRRLGVAEVMPSITEQDDRYQPLADTLDRALRALRQFDLDELDESVNRATQLCGEL